MKAEDVVKAYHLLDELKKMRTARAAFNKEGSTIEITGLPTARIMLNEDSRLRFHDLLQGRIGDIVSELELLGVERNREGTVGEATHAGS